MWLTFDWDDVTPDAKEVKLAMKELVNLFGDGYVWYRVSSSGQGLHLVIAKLAWNSASERVLLSPLEFDDKEIMGYREQFFEEPWNLECLGRLMGDSARKASGTTWGRIFALKNEELSGEWLPC